MTEVNDLIFRKLDPINVTPYRFSSTNLEQDRNVVSYYRITSNVINIVMVENRKDTNQAMLYGIVDDLVFGQILGTEEQIDRIIKIVSNICRST